MGAGIHKHMDQDSDAKNDTEPGVVEDENLSEQIDAAEKNLKRRDFLEKTGSVVVGTAIVACPVAAGLIAVFNPLINPAEGGYKVRLTVLDALPLGGAPQTFKVIVDKVDAWTTYKDLPLGMVFVRRTGEKEVEAFNASCPHAGCAVEYRNTDDAGQHYYCGCHESKFKMDGAVVLGTDPPSPAKRGLDSLEVDKDKLEQGEVWVLFQKFKAGVEEKIPVA